MPYRPNTPCRHPGCAAVVPYGQKYCEKHKALHPEEVRSAAKRGYGRKWQKASRGIPAGASAVCAVHGETAAAVCESDSG